MNKLDICKQTRKVASESLYKTLEILLNSKKPISESILRDRWLLEMRKYKSISQDGWYIPPPHGMGVLFATEDDIKRLNFTSIRPQEFWPRDDIYLDREKGIMMLYFSPVDIKSGIIGDFEMTLYFGKNKLLINQIKTSLKIISKTFKFVDVGLKFSDIAKFMDNLLMKNHLINSVYSISDPLNNNFGHTIPYSYEDMTQDENKILRLEKKDWQTVCNMISKKRRFLNISEDLELQVPMAFTIEPRCKLNDEDKSPLISFHTVVLIKENGKKELLTNFDKIFKLARMDYALNL